jgi:hypothetical protein
MRDDLPRIDVPLLPTRAVSAFLIRLELPESPFHHRPFSVKQSAKLQRCHTWSALPRTRQWPSPIRSKVQLVG